MLRIAGVPVWVGPSDVIAGARAVAGWTDEAVELVARLPEQASRLLDDAEALVGRAGAIADRADTIVGSVDTLLADVRAAADRATALVARADAVAADAAGLVARAGGVADDAGGVIDRATAVADRAGTVVGTASGAADEAAGLLATYRPIAAQAAPLAQRFVAELSEAEVHAAVRLVDQLPQLTGHLERDIMPILATLDRVGPDVHELLEQLKAVRQAIQGFPGLGYLRRRGERDDAQEAGS